MQFSLKPVSLSALTLMTLTACNQPIDFDLRGQLGNRFDTSQAATQATAKRPDADARGIISYPGYQVAVARRGDTLTSLADRIGADAAELARYNGLKQDDTLRRGELVALPKRVAETTGPIDVAAIAGNAIDSAAPTPVTTTTLAPATPSAPIGPEPVRHKVERGETAYTIARLYKVSVRALSDWNGLGRDLAVRDGQYLLIPVALENDTAEPETASVTSPGAGTQTPTPPSASTPLPQETAASTTSQAAAPASPALAETQTQSVRSQMDYPVNGSIIRAYKPGRNEGIDISANAGSPVKAAASGKVAVITTNTQQVSIIVIRHPDNLYTVYANVTGIKVSKGDSVSRGQTIASVAQGSPANVHFEVRKGTDSVDPTPYLE